MKVIINATLLVTPFALKWYHTKTTDIKVNNAITGMVSLSIFKFINPASHSINLAKNLVSMIAITIQKVNIVSNGERLNIGCADCGTISLTPNVEKPLFKILFRFGSSVTLRRP